MTDPASTSSSSLTSSPFIAPGGKRESAMVEHEGRAFPIAPAEGWLTILLEGQGDPTRDSAKSSKVGGDGGGVLGV